MVEVYRIIVIEIYDYIYLLRVFKGYKYFRILFIISMYFVDIYN